MRSWRHLQMAFGDFVEVTRCEHFSEGDGRDVYSRRSSTQHEFLSYVVLLFLAGLLVPVCLLLRI